MPSTSFDVYGLLMTAAEYGNTVVCLEPKFAYRLALGPAFPGEPTEAANHFYTVGLGCDPQNVDAVARLLSIKRRPWRAGLILIAADISQLDD